MNNIATKVCCRCKQGKSIDEFYKHWDKLQSCCKPCSKLNAAAYQETHKERCRQTARIRHAQIKREALQHYSGGVPQCAICNEDDTDVLCIDHINGGGKAHRQELRTSGGTTIFYWLRRENYPQGYQVLCANCNMKKEATGGL